MRFEMKPTPERANKLPGLELLRFSQLSLFWYFIIAILLSLPTRRSVSPRIDCLFITCAHLLRLWAHVVHVFWCISGIIFFWKYRDAIATRSIDGGKFFVLRFSRLYPLHIATLLSWPRCSRYILILMEFLWLSNNDLTHFLLNRYGEQRYDPECIELQWTDLAISVEVLVYFFFFMILLVTRSWLLNLAVIAISLMVPVQVADCFAFFYAGGLAAMARQAVTPSVYTRAAESAGWLAIIVFLLAAWQFTDGHLESMGFRCC